MPIDHGGELLIRLETLPLEARTPILEEPPCPALAFVAPQLAETLLEDIGGVEGVGHEWSLWRFSRWCRKRSLNVRVAHGCTESHPFRGFASVEAWLNFTSDLTFELDRSRV